MQPELQGEETPLHPELLSRTKEFKALSIFYSVTTIEHPEVAIKDTFNIFDVLMNSISTDMVDGYKPELENRYQGPRV